MSVNIHPTAIVDKSAVLGDGTSVGPYSIIGPKVKIGENNNLISHVVIQGNTTIGSNNEFYPFACIGTRPQDLKYKGEDSELIIGSNNTIREYVTLQPGTSGGGMKTVVGDINLFMANSHLGHDSYVGSNNVIANSVAIAGHVKIGNKVTLGGLSAVHQFVKVGDYSMLGGGSMVSLDIPPGCIAQGDRAGLVSINIIGLQRSGFQEEEISLLKKTFRKICISKGPLQDRIESAIEEISSDPKYSEQSLSAQFIEFVKSSDRGIAVHRGES